MDEQRVKSRRREVEAQDPADVENVENAGDATRIARQSIERAAAHLQSWTSSGTVACLLPAAGEPLQQHLRIIVPRAHWRWT